MTQTDGMHLLSTMPRRLARDIHFSMDIGRESPFDPFQKRDVTRLFSKKPVEGATLMYFAQKPLRRSPCPVVFARQEAKKMTSLVRPITQASYYPELPPTVKDVSFTRAPRFGASSRPASVQREKKEDKRTPSRGRDGGVHNVDALFEQVARAAAAAAAGEPRPEEAAAAEAEAAASRRRAKAEAGATSLEDSIVKVPDCRNAPSFGVMTTREGHAPSAASRRIARAATPQGMTRQRKHMLLPWELDEMQLKRDKLASAGDARGAKDGKGGKANTSAKSAGGDASASGGAAGATSGATDDPTEELEVEWDRKKQQVLARFGVGQGAASRDHARRHQRDIKGVDIAAQPGRVKGWTKFHAPGKEVFDLTYTPKYDVTTRERSVAHVELGKQAARFPKPTDSTAQDILNIDNLKKVHERMRRRERKLNVGLHAQDTGTVATSKVDTLCSADELDYNTSTLLAPNPAVTRKYHGSPDLFLCADRRDEPLAAIVGGDLSKYRDKAKAKESEAGPFKQRSQA